MRAFLFHYFPIILEAEGNTFSRRSEKQRKVGSNKNRLTYLIPGLFFPYAFFLQERITCRQFFFLYIAFSCIIENKSNSWREGILRNLNTATIWDNHCRKMKRALNTNVGQAWQMGSTAGPEDTGFQKPAAASVPMVGRLALACETTHIKEREGGLD